MAQTNKQTNRQTDGHSDSKTESAQWGRFSENQLIMNQHYQYSLLRGWPIALKIYIFSIRATHNLPLFFNQPWSFWQCCVGDIWPPWRFLWQHILRGPISGGWSTKKQIHILYSLVPSMVFSPYYYFKHVSSLVTVYLKHEWILCETNRHSRFFGKWVLKSLSNNCSWSKEWS